MLKKRVEILFEPLEYRRLEEIARTRKRSVGSVVREAVERYVLEPTQEEKRRALEWIRAQRGPVGSPDEIKKTIVDAISEQIARSLRETD